ncbi:hypothetical protein ACIQVU_02380 [Lysinibacillus sp. NPDC098008]|uniref:hypothetical protein n=1 Tax=Lysinibacillus sp. NPDC098008 TaxID=3364146 RepID=UPI00380A105D
MTVLAPQKVRGGPSMPKENTILKDVTWEIDQQLYVIHNVPVNVYEGDVNDRTYSSETTLKLLLLKDLMESAEIPSEIDYSKADALKL